MCVAVIVESQETIPSESVKAMHDANSDGGGVAWIDGDIIRYRKGLTWQEIDELQDSLPRPFFMHFRIATQGGVKPYLTHPFPIGINAFSNELEGRADAVLMHNGTWRDFDKYLPKYVDRWKVSDTQVAAYAARFDETILDEVKWANAVMQAKGEGKVDIRKRGTWYEYEGNHYSNLYWQPRAFTYERGWDDDDFDNWLAVHSGRLTKSSHQSGGTYNGSNKSGSSYSYSSSYGGYGSNSGWNGGGYSGGYGGYAGSSHPSTPSYAVKPTNGNINGYKSITDEEIAAARVLRDKARKEAEAKEAAETEAGKADDLDKTREARAKAKREKIIRQQAKRERREARKGARKRRDTAPIPLPAVQDPIGFEDTPTVELMPVKGVNDTIKANRDELYEAWVNAEFERLDREEKERAKAGKSEPTIGEVLDAQGEEGDMDGELLDCGAQLDAELDNAVIEIDIADIMDNPVDKPTYLDPQFGEVQAQLGLDARDAARKVG